MAFLGSHYPIGFVSSMAQGHRAVLSESGALRTDHRRTQLLEIRMGDAAQAQHGEQSMSPAQRKRTRPSCTVLFVDVCDSTGLYATLGNARAQAAIVKTLEILSRIAIRHRGTVVKTAGDGGLCTFPTAADGAEAAMEMQRFVQRTTTLADIGVESLAIRRAFTVDP
jgi:class 3 adenylate cyclase